MLPKNVYTLVFVCLFAVSAMAEPQLAVQLDRTTIYEGESFFYQLTVSDTNPIHDNVMPDTSAWTDFDVRSLVPKTSRQSGSFFSMTIVNGKTVKDDRSSTTYSTRFGYVLTPKHTGLQTIPFPQVTVDSKTLLPKSFSVDEGNRQIMADYSIAVQVVAPEEQDIVSLTIETNRQRLYPMQPLEVTLVMQIKGMPGRFAETSPFNVLRQLPQLHIPWSAETPKGFQSTQKAEDHTSRQIKRSDAQGNEILYWEFRFTRTLIPIEFGNYSFGPATLQGTLPVADASAPNGISGQRIYAVAKPVSIAVVDVPRENRPADYIGAFGSFRWEVNLTPHQARVGDPMTLTLRLLGEGSTINVRPIDLSALSDISDHFRVHMPPTEEFNEHACTFTYTIRPQHSGITSFPPIAVSVFDVNTEQFVSLQSLPIPLSIADAETVQSATLFGNVSSDAGQGQLAEGGLFANKMVLSETLPPITFVQWAITISLLAGGYAMIAIGVLLWRCQWTTPKQQRRRGALNRAKSRLANIKTSSELQDALFGYIADKWDRTEQGMTTNDACQLLLDHRVPEMQIHAIRTVLESLDAVKYGGIDVRSLDELTLSAATLLRQLEQY